MDVTETTPVAVSKHQKLKLGLTYAIIELCRKEAFYVEELKIEGTLCLVSDRSSVLVAQITEQIGNHEHMDDGSSQDSVPPTANSGNKNDESTTKNKSQVQRIGLTTLMKSRNRYKCPFCIKSFRFKHSLKDHINHHTGSKPHVCKFCLMSFTQFSSMCAHIKSDHQQLLSRPRTCCSCHTKPEPTTSLRLISEQNNHFSMVQTGHPNKQISMIDGTGQPNIHVDSVHFTPIPLTNIKQELCETDQAGNCTDPRSDKESQGLLDVQTFLQNFQPGRDEGEHSVHDNNSTQVNSIHSIPVSNIGVETVKGLPGANSSMLSQTVGLPTSSLSIASTSDSVVSNMNLTPNTLSGTMPSVSPSLQTATLEMLAHMAQVSQVTQALPNVSELSQVLSTQKQQMSVAPAAPVFKMPPTQNLQRSADGKFQCPYCEKTYSFKHTLKDHINKHMGNRPHCCKHCGDSFTHLASLCAHIKRRHDSQMTSDYQCEICQEKFMNLQSLKQHFTWRHKDVKFSPQRFLECSQGVVRAGENQASGLAPQSTAPLLQPAVSAPVHQFTAASKPPPSENTTPAILQSPNMGNKPVISVSSSVSSLSGQPISMAPAAARTPDQPIVSHSETNEKNKAQIDKTAVHTQPQFPGGFIYTGQVANQDTSSICSAIALQTQHAEDDSLSLTTHIADYFNEVNLHTEQGLYKYKCKICGNLFKIRNSLYEHLNSHLGKKPYVCSSCGDAFTHHSSLHNHTRNKHSHQTREEREAHFKHMCSVCNKKFRFPSELDRHFKTNPEHDVRQSTPTTSSV